jgi:AcrR family transcriptional regulator
MGSGDLPDPPTDLTADRASGVPSADDARSQSGDARASDAQAGSSRAQAGEVQPRAGEVQARAGDDRLVPVRDERLLEAAARVLQDAGWHGLTVEAVSEAAGLSRVTAWRLGASRQALVASLLQRLDQDYRQAMWPAIVGSGSARQRLDRAIDALFDVIDAHLPLLLASDTIFHRASTTKLSFNEPFMRLFEDGDIDGSVAQIAGDPEESSDVLFNVLCWPYAHLRGRHGWTAQRARQRIRGLVTPSLDPAPHQGSR